MKGKVKLRERREWIVDDLTEKERRIEWWIRREAERKRREGRKARVGYMKMWIEEKLWVWDEFKEELREWQGKEVREWRRGIEEDKGVEKEKGDF